MNCQNCKHWVFGRCTVSNLIVGPGQLCNAWELSQSHDFVETAFASFDEEELHKRVAELEAEVAELKLENERLENAWLIDETIAPDGSLRPTVSNLLDRLNQTKTELEIANGTIDYLRNRIVRLEPYKSGYDANKEFPDDGENVIANVGTWLFLASYRDGKWYDSLGAQAEIRGGVDRWWKLPEVEE